MTVRDMDTLTALASAVPAVEDMPEEPLSTFP